MAVEVEANAQQGPKVFRLLAALIVGLAVLCISLYVAWQNAIDAPLARMQQFYTQRELEGLGAAISEYEKRLGKAPHSINDLGATNDDSYVLNARLAGDGWHKPFIFSVSETNAVAISYGRDGKPGGVGLDCDLSSTNWSPAESRPTFQQFLYDMPTRGMIKSSFGCAALSFLLALFTTKAPPFTRSGIWRFALKIILVTVAAAFVATVITGLHVPSGH